ncbi:MAG: hypothetical protein K8R48_03670 [Alphaproteobacteria bacterium]|nr:hypothetical protein [Alphaproteobacteria bacterium]
MAAEEGLTMQYLGLPLWGQYLLQGILLFISIACAAVVLTRAGRSPYFALLIAVPYVQIIALWLFAFSVWPKRKKS